jgi:hypothetical protein
MHRFTWVDKADVYRVATNYSMLSPAKQKSRRFDNLEFHSKQTLRTDSYSAAGFAIGLT